MVVRVQLAHAVPRFLTLYMACTPCTAWTSHAAWVIDPFATSACISGRADFQVTAVKWLSRLGTHKSGRVRHAPMPISRRYRPLSCVISGVSLGTFESKPRTRTGDWIGSSFVSLSGEAFRRRHLSLDLASLSWQCVPPFAVLRRLARVKMG
jgi:hypothetical protein